MIDDESLFVVASSPSFSREIIGHCVWLSFRFNLSLGDVEEMMTMRGLFLSCETNREV